jgi:hypothetical protein
MQENGRFAEHFTESQPGATFTGTDSFLKA